MSDFSNRRMSEGCSKICVEKRGYTGYPYPAHPCRHMAKYLINGRRFCTRHTLEAYRRKENLIAGPGKRLGIKEGGGK